MWFFPLTQAAAVVLVFGTDWIWSTNTKWYVFWGDLIQWNKFNIFFNSMKKIVKLNANTDTLTNWQSDVILHVIKIERTICKHNHFSCVDCVEISRLMNLLQHFVHLFRWQIIGYLFLSQMLLVNSIEINFNLSKFFIHNQSKWRYNSLTLVVYSLSLVFFSFFFSAQYIDSCSFNTNKWHDIVVLKRWCERKSLRIHV